VQQRLGWDAAAVQAGATEFVLFDQRDSHSQLCGAQCCGVTAATTTKDYKVEFMISH
jgi:hypothetical protein